jgi:peptidyl-prolyl cis-trans isomerase B (cyclophilin B)
VTSLKDRQRAAARARLEREMAERQQAAAQRRRRGYGITSAVAAVVVVVVAVVLVVSLTGGGKKSSPSAAASAGATAAACGWTPDPDPSASPAAPANPNLKNVGTPPASGQPRSGTQDLTLNTNLGTMVIQMDLTHAPCTSASFAYLASQKFFNGASCHRLLNTGDTHLLQCGDPSGTGQGGPTYNFADENLPTDQRPAYPAGVVAMANTGQPGTNGSQFFIVFGDTDLPAQYTIWGKVTQGLDIATKVGAAGDDEAFAGAQADGSQGPGGGHPKTKLTFNTVTAGPVQSGPASAAPAGSAAPSASAGSSATPSVAPSAQS